jgi:hypothetical protein
MMAEIEADDLRATIEEAYDASEKESSETGGQVKDTQEPVRDTAEAPEARAETAAADDGKGKDRGDGRAADGKFAAKQETAAKEAQKDPAAQPAHGEPDQKPVDQFAKAPQSWKPGAREAWQHLPADVRAEVHRRERETARIMQETTQAREVTSYVSQLQQRFAPALQAEGVDALTASANLMNLASRLRFGTPQEKAMLAAQIIRNYGVDVENLASALDGQPMQQSQQPQMMTDPRVDQLLAQLNGMRQTQAAQVQQRVVGEVEKFGETKEFFEDVREDMADLLEVASRRGIDLTLEQAYERACAMQPEIHKVIEGRNAAKRAGNSQQSTQRARIAASSIRGTPSGVSTAEPESLRGAIEAAIESSAGR